MNAGSTLYDGKMTIANKRNSSYDNSVPGPGAYDSTKGGVGSGSKMAISKSERFINKGSEERPGPG